MSKLTRQGARNLTATLDRVATVIQNNPDLLGVDKKIAMDFARRCDLLSDAIETTAVINYPKAAAVDETGLSVEPQPGDEGFDANAIGDEVPGPLEIITPPDEPWMGGHFTQEKFVQLSEKQESGELAAAASAGAKFAALLDEAERVFTAAPKSAPIVVQAFDGFTDQIRQLEALNTKALELQAQIDAAVGPLLASKAALDKDMAKIHETLKSEYKENLAQVGTITLERKTKLVEARAMLKVAEVKGTLNAVQEDLLTKVTEKYGAEVAAFIRVETAALQDLNKTLRVAFQGFELEQRAAKTASLKQAGLVDLLTRFQDFLKKGWSKMVQMVQNVTKIVSASSDKVEAAHNDFVKVLSQDIKTASVSNRAPANTNFGGFNLFE
jgi:hypothetical protein